MTRVFTSRTIPCNPSLVAGNSSTSVSPFYRAPKMYAASVPAPLARLGGKQKYERFGNLANKGAPIGEGNANCTQNL